MRSLAPILASLCLAAASSAQSFECQPLGPFPTGGTADCENVISNNLGAGTGVSSTPACGMPIGNKYARATASASFAVLPGGPAPRPLPFITEIRAMVPEGADGVTLKWNWFRTELNPLNNDGFEIAIVAANNTTVLVPLVYIDTVTGLFAPGLCVDPVSGGTDTLSNGVETVSVAFPPLPAGAYLSIASWNGGGNTLNSSAGVVDAIAWGNPVSPSWELGDPFGPRCVDTTPLTSYRIGQPTSVQFQGGLPFLEGTHCMVAQIWDGNVAQFITPGVAGPLYICTDRPVYILSEGLLTGGSLPGRGPVVTFTLPSQIFNGMGLVIQAYVITEQLTNPTWSTALFGWFR